MKKPDRKLVQAPDLGRRRALGAAMGLGTAAGLGLFSVSGNVLAESKPTKQASNRNYRESEHIRSYYRSTRL